MEYPEDFPVEKYLVWSKISTHKKRVILAKKIISEALALTDSWYVAFSGGKDSVAMAHLVNCLYPGIAMWSHKDDSDFPGEQEYIKMVSQKFGWKEKIVTSPVPVLDFIKQNNIDVCDDVHSRTSELADALFYKQVKEQERCFNGVFLGLRAEESPARRKNYYSRGALYSRKDGKRVCTPLATWKGEDVFAYLVSNDIPIFEVYFKTKFVDGDPTKIRLDSYIPSSFSRKGNCVWLKYYYPELFYKLAQIAPEVLQYA